MHKKIFYLIPLALAIFILISIIQFANPIASFIEDRSDDSQEYSLKALWEQTWGKKISEISWCSIKGGKEIRINSWFNTVPEYRCIPSYSDKGKACKNSNDCKGDCLIVSPQPDYNKSSTDDPVLNSCTGLGEAETRTTISGVEKRYEKYSCENTLFKSKCSEFEWDNQNQWEINDNVINYNEVFYDL